MKRRLRVLQGMILLMVFTAAFAFGVPIAQACWYGTLCCNDIASYSHDCIEHSCCNHEGTTCCEEDWYVCIDPTVPPAMSGPAIAAIVSSHNCYWRETSK